MPAPAEASHAGTASLVYRAHDLCRQSRSTSDGPAKVTEAGSPGDGASVVTFALSARSAPTTTIASRQRADARTTTVRA